MKTHSSSEMEQLGTRSKKAHLNYAERYSQALNLLIENLSDSVRQKELFRTRYASFFDEDDMSGPIAQIESDFEALSESLIELQNLRKRCVSHTSDVR